MNKSVKISVIIIRVALGLLLIYGGVNKFIPKPPRPQTEETKELAPHVLKIKAFIGGLKQSGYFWPFLGAAEIVCGVLLISQILSLLGAVMSVPITLNIFLFHAFLEPHDTVELLMTGAYLTGNLLVIAYAFPKLKSVFFPIKQNK
ncbi:DoxX family membrane protein [Reichenbachiella sp. MALMAid0571]|uniref:DoxX family membrane protein n=1 Tax=Reichenbachiella sp. MALMAid0571 TaxID=3143939 RepID=UPI0032E00EC6